MARYNTVSTTSSVAGGSTITTPSSGLLTTLTGSGTVTVPNPVYYTGQTQSYNSTGSAIILSTPSGVINGPGLGGGANTLSLPAGSIITLISDGTNYLTQDWLGGNVSASTLSATSSVNLSPGTGSVTISPSSAGTINNMSIGASTASTGAFTTLSASSTVTLSPLNTNVVIQPSGTGVVTIKSAAAGTIDNMAIGSTTASTGAFTSLSTTTTATIGTSATITTTATIGTTTASTMSPTAFAYSGAANVSAGAWETSSGLLVGKAVNNGDTSVFIGTDNGSTRYGWIGAVNKSVAYTTLAINPSGTGNVSIGSTTANVSLDISNRTDALALPRGNTAQRPGSPVAGYMRMNTQTSYAEFYNGSAWQSIAGPYTVTYLVVAGGGGGGTNGPGPGYGSGGGAGGALTGTFLATPGQSYTITVGNGGSYPANSSSTGTNGGASSISGGTVSVSAVGGGGGASPSSLVGQPGGSGGGAGATAAGAGSGTAGQGNPGGNTTGPGNGGGGWGTAGNAGIGGTYAGGDGQSSSITGSGTYYAGGGGAGGPTTQYPGGLGGGGAGGGNVTAYAPPGSCLLYTSDAADE